MLDTVKAIAEQEAERINTENRTLALLATQIYQYMGGEGEGLILDRWLPCKESKAAKADPQTVEAVRRLWKARKLPLWVASLLSDCLRKA